jgi:hypothetical protein
MLVGMEVVFVVAVVAKEIMCPSQLATAIDTEATASGSTSQEVGQEKQRL